MIIQTQDIKRKTGFSLPDFFLLLCSGLCCIVGILGIFFTVAGFNSTAAILQELGSDGAGLTLLFTFAALAVSVFFFSMAAVLNKMAWR